MGMITSARRTPHPSISTTRSGSGSPVVLIHGWPLSGASWEKQTAALLKAGHRVITYDRRGFGRSSQPAVGYDYDTFAADLDVVLKTLDLRDVALVGFSMGSGEVTRTSGVWDRAGAQSRADRHAWAYLVKAPDNAEESIRACSKASHAPSGRIGRRSCSTSCTTSTTTTYRRKARERSGRGRQLERGVGASPTGTLACVDAWIEDFRKDIPKNTVPTLIIHGDADRILPPDATSRRQAKMIKDVKFVELAGGPHGVRWTHADQINTELVRFLA